MKILDKLTPYQKEKFIKDLTVKKLWESFADSVMLSSGIKKDSVQYIECEKMWFTGFSEGLRVLSVLVDAVTEEQACKKLSEFHEETQKFYSEMAKRAGMVGEY